ncbi:MAG: hypothetical protein IPK53_03225 [bacterium]|nr:hypothetical protein [bacterium]
MTTNGVLFARALSLKQAGLSGVNISLDSPESGAYQEDRAQRRNETSAPIYRGCDSDRFELVKINMVVMAGVNEHEMLDFVELAKRKPVNVRFIEYMPFKGISGIRLALWSYAAMRERIEQTYALHAMPDNSLPNRVAEDFMIPGFRGKISFIASMSRSFCSTARVFAL